MATPKQYTAEDLLVRPQQYPNDPGLVLEVTPESAGWDYISFQVRRLRQGESWSFSSGENELALINLTGSFAVNSNRGEWSKIGGRESVFEAAAHALYLPRRSTFTVTALDDCEFAVTWTPTDQDRAAFLRTPQEVPISVRGRQREPADQRPAAAGVAGAPARAGGGLHAERQLEQLSPAQA